MDQAGKDFTVLPIIQKRMEGENEDFRGDSVRFFEF